MKRRITVIFILVLVFAVMLAVTASALPTNYTYIYSFWGDEVPTPDAYYVSSVITGGSLGTYNFRSPQDLHASKTTDRIFVADTGNNRIAVIQYDRAADTFELIREIYGVYVDEADMPVAAKGEAVSTGDYDYDDYDDGEEQEETDDDNPATDETDEDEITDESNVDRSQFARTDEEPENGDEIHAEEIEIGDDIPTDNEDEQPQTDEFPLYNEDGLIWSAFNQPHGIFEDKETGEIFIADTSNQRIVRLDADFNYIASIKKPQDGSVDQSLEFLPAKLVVDPSSRIFVQVRNVNRGFMEFSLEGDFIGYIGAAPVNLSMIDRFWRAIRTSEQIERDIFIVATEFNNVSVDHDGFLYATLAVFSGNPFGADVGVVRRLNAIGDDILVRNAKYGWDANTDNTTPPAGDQNWGSHGGFTGPSRFVDVVAFANDSYACLDRNKGRIFGYDFQGNLLYVFGGYGNKEGFFQGAVAIDEMNYELFVLDWRTADITHFKLTEYGSYINQAMNYYYIGSYDESAEMWDKVLSLNAGYELAYAGKGRAALRNEEYLKAMELFEYRGDQEQYGKAFAMYRKVWIEERIVEIIVGVLSLYIAVKVIGYIIKRRRRKREGGSS